MPWTGGPGPNGKRGKQDWRDALWLRALVTLPEDPAPTRRLTTIYTLVPGDAIPSSGLCISRYVCSTQTYTQAKIHTCNKILKEKWGEEFMWVLLSYWGVDMT